VWPQGGGTQDTPDETLFAAIIYVLVSGCAWRQLPPCFGISKSTMSWLTGYRRLSPRYERNPRNYLAFLGLAAALCCYKRLVRLTT
jgi:transposase